MDGDQKPQLNRWNGVFVCVVCLAVIFGSMTARASDASVPLAVRIGLTRSKEHKLVLPARAPGGTASFEVDTGAPFTCADQTKVALFKFRPLPPGAEASSVTLNGHLDKIMAIPQIDFGGWGVKDLPVALVDLASINQMHRANHDGTDDGILGLDALCRFHAVLDFGARRLFLHSKPVHFDAPEGWLAVPMQMVARHLIVPATLNGYKTFFIVDTGAPSSIIDSALCLNLRIPVGRPGISMKAIHHETEAAYGNIADLQIGSIALGQTTVAVFDLNALVGKGNGSEPITGIIGGQTLESLRAIIDCNAMQLYIKKPGRGAWWSF